MDELEAWELLRSARVGHLATSGPDGTPHVVPFVFVLDGRTAYWAVDTKPKRSRELKRLTNIRTNPNVEFAVDGYAEEWTDLWWVRAKGTARILDQGAEWNRAVTLLTQKYPQYETTPPPGPVVAIDIVRIVSWKARNGGA